MPESSPFHDKAAPPHLRGDHLSDPDTPARERAFEFASYIEEMRSGIDSLWERVKDRDSEMEELASRVLLTANKIDSVANRIAEEGRARDTQVIRLTQTAEALAERLSTLEAGVGALKGHHHNGSAHPVDGGLNETSRPRWDEA